MKAYLILQDRTIFTGQSMGKRGQTIGEVVFTTAMGGYMETLTDPSYYGQLIAQTFPTIGNYGTITADMESKKVFASGYIVRDLCEFGSNFRKESELNDFLIEQNVVGIKDIDTRELTKKIRGQVCINAMITDNLNDLDKKIIEIKNYRVIDAFKNTSVDKISESGEGFRVVLIDYGAKLNIERILIRKGCKVIVVPHNTSFEEILSLKPDGVMLSNGAGNPADNKYEIEQIKKLVDHKIPIFGICMGHQLLALSIGAKTRRIKFGHRGANQPVMDLSSKRVYITSQNHGYEILINSLPKDKVRQIMINVNDKTNEGMELIDYPAFSVQFHPEASCGPMDTEFLFDKFINLIKQNKKQGA